MGEQLYYKRVTPGGRTVYDPVFTQWEGDPADGIWYVKKEKGWQSFRWICERLEDLPQARKLAELEPYRDEIARRIGTLLGRSLNDIITIAFRVLTKSVSPT